MPRRRFANAFRMPFERVLTGHHVFFFFFSEESWYFKNRSYIYLIKSCFTQYIIYIYIHMSLYLSLNINDHNSKILLMYKKQPVV